MRIAALRRMDDRQLQHLRAKLDAREAELRAEVRFVNAEHEGTPHEVPMSHVEDEVEQADARIRGAIRHAEKERDLEELRDIAAARERMAAGRYGVCVECGCDIPLARLEVEPATPRCITCQERFERTHFVGVGTPPVL